MGALFIPQELKEKNRTAFVLAKESGVKHSYLNVKLYKALESKTRFGESRQEAKAKAIEERKAWCAEHEEKFYLKDARVDGIYSHGTFTNYLKVGARFNEWLEAEKGITDTKSIKATARRYGVEYLESLKEREVSYYTIAQAKSCLGKLAEREINYQLEPQRYQEITKGRLTSQRMSLFREDLNKDLVLIAKATGGRRGDLERLELKDFVRGKSGEVIGVKFEQSKGGRDRFSPILPTYQIAVTRLVDEKERQGKEKVFDRVNSKANIHSYRRFYAQEVYKYTQDHKGYRESLLEAYRGLGYSLPKEYSEIYRTKDGRDFDREALFTTSQALGHSRLAVVPNNYFR